MRANYRVNASPRFDLLSSDQCEEIYGAALRVLARPGLLVHSDRARHCLRDNGAVVNGKRVCLPSFLVERARRLAPRTFTLYGRGGSHGERLEISPNHIHYGPSITATHFLDPRTGERRQYVLEDAATVAVVCDALPNIDYVAAQGTISDVDQSLVEVYEFAALTANCRKPVMAWSNTLEGCQDVHRIAVTVAGGEGELVNHPSYFFLGCPISPLVVPEEVAEQLMFCAEHGVPYVFGPCPMCGATTPCTLASTLVMATAECLLALVLHQIVNPGAPFIMGGSLATMDMRDSTMPYGAPELAILCAAESEIARFIGVPVWSTAGVSDSKLVDGQAAFEGAVNTVVSALSGADLIHNVGFIEGCLTGSLQFLVMMDEAIAYAKRLLRGIEVTPETLAVDLIADVGPGGGFLSTEHTMQHFRTEFWYPSILDRRTREAWGAAGRTSLWDRAQEKLNRILDKHQVPPLPAEVQRDVDAILEESEARLSTA